MAGHTIDSGDRLSINITLQHLQRDHKYPARTHARKVAAQLAAQSSAYNGLIYLPGQMTRMLPDSDQAEPFRQLRYFYYLSGVDEPDCFLTYDIAKDLLTLYITVVPPLQSIWFGPGLSLKDAQTRYDAHVVKSAESLNPDLRTWIGENAGHPVFILHDSQKPKLDLSTIADPFDSSSLQAAIIACRVIKDDFELALIQKANDISAKAHTEVLRNIKHIKNEREVQAIFHEVSTSNGVTSQSYGVIAGSGPNAAILHYMKNNEPVRGRQLFLLDAGCDWNCYASDVTRTFPISGHWPSKEAKAIYDLVDDMQTSCIERIKPGVAMADLQMLAHQIMTAGLQKLGILKADRSFDEIYKAGASKIFLPHGLGHHVGLEVHDVSPRPINSTNQNGESIGQDSHKFSAVPPPHSLEHVTLEKNMVITIEPGIYFSQIALDQLITEELLEYIDVDEAKKYLDVGGVRIEDDILVTAYGHKNMTTAPKGEEAMAIIRGE